MFHFVSPVSVVSVETAKQVIFELDFN